jgi:hypothetical protein
MLLKYQEWPYGMNIIQLTRVRHSYTIVSCSHGSDKNTK